MNPFSRTGFATLLLAGIFCLLAACTSREVYESVQTSRLLECERLPVWRQADCRAPYEESWQDYQREREALIISSD